MRLARCFRDHVTNFEFPHKPGMATRVVIGRPREGSPPPDLDLTPDFTASRPHAAITIEADGTFYVEDLHSTHGTQLNGRDIREEGPVGLLDGDVLRMGETYLRINAAFDQNAPQMQAFMRAQNLRNALLDLKIGGELDARRVRPSMVMALPEVVAPGAPDSATLLSNVFELPLEFAAQTELALLLQLIVQKLVDTIPGATRGALVLCESDKELGHGLQGTDSDSEPAGLEALVPHAYYPHDGPPIVSRMLAWRAMTERTGFIWHLGEDGQSTPVSGSIVRFGIESGMYAPLLWQDVALGAVCVDNGAGGHTSFTQDDLRLMLMVGQYAAMAVANQQLQEEMRSAWLGALEALTAALATRDNDTQTHCYRTVELAVVLARKLGVPENEIPAIARGALLHDIGKIGIPDNILRKPGTLTPEERETMKEHAQLGHDMLNPIPFFQDALPIVLHHHEKYSGGGYPSGISGNSIPRGARIFHVVDIYDALTQQRPYKPAWTHEAAMQEIRQLSGNQCDPEVVAALESLDPGVTARIRSLRDFSPEVRHLLGRGSF
jgi:putative nucleotidyltransferase with HDIG domain